MKVALVTGAAGGIGYATVTLLKANGYAVVAMDVLPYDLVAEKFKASDKECVYIQGNLASTEDRSKAVKACIDTFGGLTVLCNVAGVAPKVRNDILEMTEESYDFVTDINTRGTLFLTQLAARQMLTQAPDEKTGLRGFIVNVSSCSAYTSSTSRGEYCISKAGVTMITTLFADRLAKDGILVNEICPGVIATGMTATVKAKYDKLIEEGLIPQNRWGMPEDCAKTILALCDGSLGYTTGQSIAVDGGMHIRRL
ncbi:MAG: 3-ketoacyl-ACP reductase [Clostridia bacterium]|nr:3-ketoacyl-ACP reductase [Clostridia bacterium]